MAQLEPHRVSTESATPPDGVAGRGLTLPGRYCALCGRDTTPEGPAVERFGEPFCSEAHADAFAREVRVARVQAAAASTGTAQPAGCAIGQGAAPGSWTGYLGKALCWGAPILIVAVLVLGGTGALTGAAGTALPFLAVLACPLGMYFMMRSMSKRGHQDDGGDKGGQK